MKYWGVLGLVGGLGVAIYTPDEYYPGYLKPVHHLFNISKGGAQMAYVYYFHKGTLE